MADASKVPLWKRAEEFEKTLHVFDILFVRSKGLIAKLTLAAQGSERTEVPAHSRMFSIAKWLVTLLAVLAGRRTWDSSLSLFFDRIGRGHHTNAPFVYRGERFTQGVENVIGADDVG